MFLRLPLGSARRFAALLLLLGVMLGGAVDAIACEPASEITAINAADAEPLGQKQLPDDERHGDCIHGHCHHGGQLVAALDNSSELLIASAEHQPVGESRLASITLDSPKRPPRA